MDETLRAGLIDAWEGELFGDLLMRRLRTTLADGEARADDLALMARVERLTAAALATRLAPLPEGAAARARARVDTVAPRFADWAGFVAASVASLPAPLARFRALVPLADAATRPLVDLLVWHEEALLAFLRDGGADVLVAVATGLEAFLAGQKPAPA